MAISSQAAVSWERINGIISELSDPQCEPEKYLGFFLSVLRPPNMFKLCSWQLLLKDVSKLVLMTNAMLSPLKLPKQDFIREKRKKCKNGGRRQKAKKYLEMSEKHWRHNHKSILFNSLD